MYHWGVCACVCACTHMCVHRMCVHAFVVHVCVHVCVRACVCARMRTSNYIISLCICSIFFIGTMLIIYKGAPQSQTVHLVMATIPFMLQ